MSAADRGVGPGFLPALEGVRGVAALWVLVYHAAARTGATPVGPWPLAPIVASGSLGVDVFFVLSGCVLTLGVVAGTAPRPGRRFLLRRAARLLPAAWVALVVTVVAAPLVVADPETIRRTITPESVAANALLLGGVGRLLPGYDGAIGFAGDPVLWSLTPEVLFCALIVLLAVPLRRRPTTLAVAALLFGVAFRAMHADARVVSVVAPLLTAFPAGVLAAVAIAGGRVRPALVRGLLVAGGAVLAAVVLTRDPGDLRELKRATTDGVAVPLLVALGTAAVLVGLADAHRSAAGRLLATRPLRALGRWSYGIYLFHFLVLGALLWTAGLPHDGSWRAWVLAVAVGTPISVLAGAGSFRLVERPAQRWVRPRAGRPPVPSPSREVPDVPPTS